MEKNLKKIMPVMLVILLFLSSNSMAIKISRSNSTENIEEIDSLIIKQIETQENEVEPIVKSTTNINEDLDPYTDITIQIDIKEIRAYDELDKLSDPDFYMKIYVNDELYESQVWQNKKYVKNPNFIINHDVPDDEPLVNIKIQLFDKDLGIDKLCDLNKEFNIFDDSKEVDLIYDIRTGHWWGDDSVSHYLSWDARADSSGYGRLNGCDDGSIYEKDMDCEVLFDIIQPDYDNDGIPYWTEVNVFNTDPELSDIGRDDDNDGVPMEWEFKWGHEAWWNRQQQDWNQGWLYDPYTFEDHKNIDFDEDGIDNVEEYLAESEGFLTNPFRKDILLEIDQMQIGPYGEGALIPELTKELLWDAYGKHNILFQIDDQGQTLPFDYNTSGWDGTEEQEIYYKYFLNEDYNNWRRGAFHYAPILYRSDDHPGNMYYSIQGDWDGVWEFTPTRNTNVSIYADCFQVSTRNHEKLPYRWPLRYLIRHKTMDKEVQRATVYASAMMHETGHVLGIYHSNVPGCDNHSATRPWNKGFYIWRPYKSVMNYAYMYEFVDYSDGSHGKNDFDDWNNIDLTLFQIERNQYFQGFD